MSADPNLPNFPKPPLARLALNEHDALPAGTRFGEFEIVRALGVGGFGIVYLAQDHSLERQVALKEYMPAALAARGAGAMITIRASSFAETYAIGLRSFINEARLLARFDHPSLVKVYRFWEDNGTAYMVMPYLQGRTLRDARRTLGGPPDELWIRSVLDPMLDALELLHREGVFHRDIAPDNILLTPEGTPILLDFGAARRVISDRTQSLTAILKPSYAPIEQYAEMAAMRQGPWTDIYALGAVLHYLLFGVPPAPATARAVQADAEQIEQRVVAGVSPRFMSAVAWMLGVRPLERPQNVASVRAALNGSLPIPTSVQHEVTRPMVTPVPPTAFDPTVVDAPFSPTVRVEGPSHVAETQPDTRYQVTERAAARDVVQRSVSSAAPEVGPAPLRSTPPGTAPPAYVPPPRPPKAASMPATAAETAVAADPPSSRRGWAITGGLGAFLVAGIVLWQFVGVIGRPRPVGPSPVGLAASVGQVASVPPWSAEASSPSAPAPRPVNVRTSEATAGLAPAPELVPEAAPTPEARRPRVARNVVPNHTEPLVAAGPATARQACGGRTFISLAICIDRECERPRFRENPECVRVLEAKRRRAGNY